MQNKIRPISRICAPVFPPEDADFELIEDPTLNESVKNILKEAITHSMEPSIWDREVMVAVKKQFPQAAIIQAPGNLSSFKDLNTYEVKMLISEFYSNTDTACEVSVNFKINQEGNTRKVYFIE